MRFFAYPLATPPAPLGSTIIFAGGDSVSDAELDRVTPVGDINTLAFAPNGNAIIAGTHACGYVLVCN